MEIDNALTPVITPPLQQDLTDQPTNNAFASMLEAERLVATNTAARDEVLAGQQAPKENENQDDIEYIREHGMAAFAEEMHKRKLEELREKILEAMGLTEETLAELPADQRQAIEDAIAEQIKQYLAANALSNEEADNKNSQVPGAAATKYDPQNLLAAQMLAGDPNSYIGKVISDVAIETTGSKEEALDKEKA